MEPYLIIKSISARQINFTPNNEMHSFMQMIVSSIDTLEDSHCSSVVYGFELHVDPELPNHRGRY